MIALRRIISVRSSAYICSEDTVMRVNPLLAEMSVNDLQRRYSGAFVRYKDRIVLVEDFALMAGSAVKFMYTTEKGRVTEQFNPTLLDIERPKPRWIYQAHRKAAYYLNYTFDRQWHRGITRQNTQITCLNAKGVSQVRIPSVELFEVINDFYLAPFHSIKCSMQDVKAQIAKDGFAPLSPYIMIAKLNSPAIGKEQSYVWYREKCVGGLGDIESIFVQELKELVGDYTNENNAKHVPGGKSATIIKQIQRPVEFMVEAPDVVFEPPRRQAGPRRFALDMGRGEVAGDAPVVHQDEPDAIADLAELFGRDDPPPNAEEQERARQAIGRLVARARRGGNGN